MDSGEQALASLSPPPVLDVKPQLGRPPEYLGSSSEKWDKNGSRLGWVETKI